MKITRDGFKKAQQGDHLCQTVITRFSQLAHHGRMSGHPGQFRMFQSQRNSSYWPAMATDVATMVRDCEKVAKNLFILKRKTNPILLFPATRPLECITLYILGSFTKNKKILQSVSVILYHVSKIPQVVPLQCIYLHVVTDAFEKHCLFKYGVPMTVHYDIGFRFASKLFQGLFQIMGTTNQYNSSYHPQINRQTEGYNRKVTWNRKITYMLRCYVSDH